MNNDTFPWVMLLLLAFWMPMYILLNEQKYPYEFVRFECVTLPHDGLDRPVCDCRAVTRRIP